MGVLKDQSLSLELIKAGGNAYRLICTKLLQIEDNTAKQGRVQYIKLPQYHMNKALDTPENQYSRIPSCLNQLSICDQNQALQPGRCYFLKEALNTCEKPVDDCVV